MVVAFGADKVYEACVDNMYAERCHRRDVTSMRRDVIDGKESETRCDTRRYTPTTYTHLNIIHSTMSSEKQETIEER